jgi:dTDP-4-dehydrorhamnose 3,5-epimerase
MRIEPASIEGVWIIQNEIYSDQRGSFQEWFQGERFKAATGIDFKPRQANSSLSKKGVIRGIHYSTSIDGQAKLATCSGGEVLDVIFDIRKDSKTFGQHVAVPMRAQDGKSIYIAEGLGHAFISLAENSSLIYLLSSVYNPNTEHAVHPFDKTLNFKWPLEKVTISDRDATAPTLQQQIDADNLPGMN